MTENVHVKDRDIVVPGDLLAEGVEMLPAGKAFRDGEKIFSSTIGIVSIKGRVVKVIPLAGVYMPRRGDVIIGKITAIGHSGWQLDVNCPYNADMNIGEATSEYIDLAKTTMSKYFDTGEYVLGEVLAVTDNKFVKITAKHRPYKKLKSGNIIEVSPTKIPRIIGKAGSMIKLLKDNSDCEIIVGQNGWVWIKGVPEKEALVARVIKIIEKESHLKGLTDKIKTMMEGGPSEHSSRGLAAGEARK